jgi:hypothetical protein
MRDLATFSDNGEAYGWQIVQGSIVLCQPGQTAVVESVMTESAGGTTPVAGVLLDEIAGDFELLQDFVNDPPLLPPSNSISSQRFYLAQAANPLECRHLQFQVQFPVAAVLDQLLSMTIFGAQQS